MRHVKKALLLATGAAAILASSANAATNLDFETGDLSGWSAIGNADAYNSYGDFLTHDGEYLAAVTAGLGQDVYSTLSQTFVLAAGETITGYAGFQAADYGDYNDGGYLSVNGTSLLTWSIATVGDYGNSGWNAFSFTALTAGSYVLQLGVANRGDNNISSGAVLNSVAVSPAAAVPEPASWAMMVMGFGLAGASLRSRRSAVRFA